MPWVVPGGANRPPSPPEPDSEFDHGGRRRPLMVVAAILGVLALVAATVGFVGGDDDGDLSLSDPTSTTLDPSPAPAPTEVPDPQVPRSSTTTAPPVSEAEFLAVVEELKGFVADARGLPFIEPVSVELEADDAFEARLFTDFDEQAEEFERSEVLYRSLGLLQGEDRLIDLLRGIYAAGVLGFYDPETNELVVRGQAPTPFVRQTIVHELVHALDDQHFELDRPAYDDRKDEIEAGFSAVVEGNARRIENRWLGEQPADVREKAGEERQAFAARIDTSSFPPILAFVLEASYSLGEVFVGTLVSASGERSVDAAITEPPDTSEQFLFPDVFTEREPRIEVPPPPADGEIVDDGVLGALLLFGLLTTSDAGIGQVDAVRAVEGWGGDWATTWTVDDAACIRADLVGDTDGDTGEIEAALEQYVEEFGGEVSMVDGRVRLERCGAMAGGVPPQV